MEVDKLLMSLEDKNMLIEAYAAISSYVMRKQPTEPDYPVPNVPPRHESSQLYYRLD